MAHKLIALAVGVAIASAALTSHAAGTDRMARDFSFYGDKNEGWFFYNDPPPPPPPAQPPPEAQEPPPAVPPPPPPTPPKTEPFSVAWLREKLPILRDAAINNPSKDNVRAYMYAQRMMIDMADGFATQGQQVVTSDPYLNEAYRMPSATFAKRSTLFAIDKAKKEILADVSEKAGLWFFFESTCLYCATQFKTLQRIAKENGFVVKNISLDGKPLAGMDEFVTDQGRKVFQRLNLAVSPAVVLAYPPDKFLVVAHGAMAQDELLDKIVLAATEQQLVPKELTDVVQLERRGIVTADDIASMRAKDVDSNDPKVLVNMMQQAIQGRLH